MAEEQAGAAPAQSPVRDDKSAVEAIKLQLQSPGPSKEREAPAKTKPEPVKAQESEAPESTGEEEVRTTEGTQDAEPEEGSDELPEYLDEIASALGTDPEKLIKALKVKLKDGSAATVQDLIEGQLRDADYRRKTQALAEQRKQIETEATQHLTALRQKAESISNLEMMMVRELQLDNAALEAMLKDEYTDPMAFERRKAERDKRLGILNQLHMQRVQAQQQAQVAQAEQVKTRRSQETESLLRLYPELKDSKKQESFQSRIGQYLMDARGFTNQEVREYFQGAWDHRHVGIIKDAADRWFEKKAGPALVKKLSEKPIVAKPGTGTQTSAEERRNSTQGLAEKLRHARNKGRIEQDKLGLDLIRAKLKG